MADNNDDDDQAGYKIPPPKYRFRPGKSGNPAGRPPKEPVNNFSEAVAKEGDRKFSVVIDGKKKRLPLRQLVARKLWQEAANGDARALLLIHKCDTTLKKIEPAEDLEEVIEVTLVLEDGEERKIN